MNLPLLPIKFAVAVAETALLGVCVWIGLGNDRTAHLKPRPVLVEVEKGQGVKAIAETLKREGVLTKMTPFLWRYRAFYGGRNLKAGQYQLQAPSVPRAVIETLIQGRVYLRPVTVIEGLTGREIFPVFIGEGFGTLNGFEEAFKAADLIGLWDPNAPDLEGYLFPETYRLPKGIKAAEITGKMVDQFKFVFTERLRRRTAELGWTVRDAVTLASLIEKETGRAEEKTLVSSVFHNRLRLGMKLDCDPTIIYPLKLAGTYEGRLRSKDLKLDSPYNTYRYPGLPPGPICNPGRDSIEAALFPAATDFLFFVSRNDGSHQFSRTLREHSQAVNRFQR